MGQQEVYNVLKKEEWLSIKELKEVIGDVTSNSIQRALRSMVNHGEVAKRRRVNI